MFRLTDDEIETRISAFIDAHPDSAWDSNMAFRDMCQGQMKKLLLGISKETKRLDQTTYLVPDYSKFKEALEEMSDV